jgi:hypothetical protein
MYLSGACPGTAVVQLGTYQLWNAKYTLLGSLMGAMSFGYFVAFVKKRNKIFLEKFDTPLLDKLLGR